MTYRIIAIFHFFVSLSTFDFYNWATFSPFLITGAMYCKFIPRAAILFLLNRFAQLLSPVVACSVSFPHWFPPAVLGCIASLVWFVPWESCSTIFFPVGVALCFPSWIVVTDYGVLIIGGGVLIGVVTRFSGTAVFDMPSPIFFSVTNPRYSLSSIRRLVFVSFTFEISILFAVFFFRPPAIFDVSVRLYRAPRGKARERSGLKTPY